MESAHHGTTAPPRVMPHDVDRCTLSRAVAPCTAFVFLDAANCQGACPLAWCCRFPHRPPANAPATMSGADKLRQFRVQNLLGKGAFGDVYKVVRISDGVTYAMKKISIASMSTKEVADTLNEIRCGHLPSSRSSNIDPLSQQLHRLACSIALLLSWNVALCAVVRCRHARERPPLYAVRAAAPRMSSCERCMSFCDASM